MTDKAALEYGDVTIELKEAVDTWKAPLEKVFPTVSGQTEAKAVKEQLFNTDSIHICSHKIGQQLYLFLYSQEQTVSMTAQKHLNVPERK